MNDLSKWRHLDNYIIHYCLRYPKADKKEVLGFLKISGLIERPKKNIMEYIDSMIGYTKNLKVRREKTSDALNAIEEIPLGANPFMEFTKEKK